MASISLSSSARTVQFFACITTCADHPLGPPMSIHHASLLILPGPVALPLLRLMCLAVALIRLRCLAVALLSLPSLAVMPHCFSRWMTCGRPPACARLWGPTTQAWRSACYWATTMEYKSQGRLTLPIAWPLTGFFG